MSPLKRISMLCVLSLLGAIMFAGLSMAATVPDTTITSHPTDPTTDTSATFTFTSNDSSAVFKCNLDGAGYSLCTSPKTYTNLAAGSHTFLVKAKNAAGADQTPASFTWTIQSGGGGGGGGTGATPGVGTGTASQCTKVISPGATTLQSAASTSGGGTICLHKGVYGGLGVTNKITGSGTSSNRLVVKSYPGETAEVRGQLTYSNSSYLTIRDLYINGRYQAFSSGGGVTNDGNPDMTPDMLVAGSHVIFTNNNVDGGNGDTSAASGTRPLDERSTCIGYRNPSDDHLVGNWIHNCGVTAAHSHDGKADGHAVYFSNANGSAPHEFSDNILWGAPANAIDLHGTNVGPYNYDVANNIVFNSDHAVDFNNFNHSTNLHNNILIDNPTGPPIVRYDQGQGSNFIQDNCLDASIQINNPASLTVRNNVTDTSAGHTGTPDAGNFVINASSACLAKYGGDMYP